MRRMIIDTDCGSDDAVALILALKSKDVKVEGITTVCGNVPLELATKNALMTMELAGGQIPPLYIGAEKPLFRELVTAVNVHGEDGMGDMDLIHPSLLPEKEHAVEALLRIVRTYPGEIELVTLGPLTNIALAWQKDPETMKKLKHIYSMGTAGFGRGNTTPVAEFNVYVDAEAYQIMLNMSVPVTIIGFDLCIGDAAWTKEDMETMMESGKPEAVFAVQCNKALLAYNLKRSGEYIVDLPDAVAMGVALWPEVSVERVPCHCYTCTMEEPAYGQVILDDGAVLAVSEGFEHGEPNAEVCKSIKIQLFKKKMMETLLA